MPYDHKDFGIDLPEDYGILTCMIGTAFTTKRKSSQKTAERVSPVTGSGPHAGKEINYSI